MRSPRTSRYQARPAAKSDGRSSTRLDSTSIPRTVVGPGPPPVRFPAHMELLLVRHARPERVEGAAGPADPPLSPLGRRQAAALAEWLAVEPGVAPLAAVYTSPLRRAAETAAPLAAALGLTPVAEDALAEYDAEANDYIPIEELRA